MRAVTELDGGLWAAECMGWVEVFSTQPVFLRLKNSQLNLIQLIICIEINAAQPINGLCTCSYMFHVL